MKKSLFVIVLMSFFSMNVRAGALDTIAEYVAEHPTSWNGRRVKNIVEKYMAANDIAKQMVKDDVGEAWKTVGRVAALNIGDESSTHSSIPLLPFLFLTRDMDFEQKLRTYLLLTTLFTLAGLVVTLLPAAVAAIIGTGYSGTKGVVFAKLKGNDSYYEHLLQGFEAIDDIPDTHSKLIKIFSDIHDVNKRIDQRGFSPLLKTRRTFLKAKVRTTLFVKRHKAKKVSTKKEKKPATVKKQIRQEQEPAPHEGWILEASFGMPPETPPPSRSR